MAAFQKRIILIAEAIFVIMYWLVIFVVPYLLSLQMRDSFADAANHIPGDLSMIWGVFTIWFDVYIMKFHRDLLCGLSLDFKWFNPLKVPPFILIAVRYLTRVFMGWNVRKENGEAEIMHIAFCRFNVHA
jgi:hypothetical protein